MSFATTIRKKFLRENLNVIYRFARLQRNRTGESLSLNCTEEFVKDSEFESNLTSTNIDSSQKSCLTHLIGLESIKDVTF